MMERLNFERETIEIRQANGSDASSLIELVAELGYTLEVSTALERLNELTVAGDQLLVAVREAKVVGLVHIHRTRFLHRPPDGRITTLVVSDKYRGCGIGTFLIEAAERIFRKWGCGRIEVTSGNAREGAYRFYKRAGYTGSNQKGSSKCYKAQKDLVGVL